MKQEILEKKMNELLQGWRLEEQDARNRRLSERMAVPRTTEEMLLGLAALKGLNLCGHKSARTQISQKDVFIV